MSRIFTHGQGPTFPNYFANIQVQHALIDRIDIQEVPLCALKSARRHLKQIEPNF